VDDLVGGQVAGVVEVRAGGDAQAVDAAELGRELARVESLAGIEGRFKVPVGSDAEQHALAFTLDDESGGDRLDPAGGQPAHDLLPQHRADLVAVEAVEDAAGLLGIDQIHVDIARMGDGVLNGVLGDLVEDDAFDRNRRFELIEQVPSDGLTLAVLIRREYELVCFLEQLLELGHLLLLLRRHDIDRLETVVDVDAEARPRLTLVLGRNLISTLGQIADVSDRGVHDIAVAEIARDAADLVGRLDNDEGGQGCSPRFSMLQ